MKAQCGTLALNFGPNEAARGVHARVMDVVREIVATATNKQVAYDLDISPSSLADALAERQDRGIKLAWLPVLMARAAPAQRIELLAALGDSHQLDVVPRKVLTPEERLARLEEALRTKLGPVGEQLIKEVGR